MQMDAVSIRWIDTLFSILVFNNMEMGEGGPSKKSRVLDEEEIKGNSFRTTPLSEPPRLLRCRPFARKN